MAEEQYLINLLQPKIQAGDDISDYIPKIQQEFSRSVVLQYYLGYFYERRGNSQDAEAQYLTCINLEHSFVQPYLNLCNMFVLQGRTKEAHTIASSVFCQKTLDMTSRTRVKKFSFIDQLQMCSILGPALVKAGEPDKASKMYSYLMSKYKDLKPAEIAYHHVEGYKNLCNSLGSLYLNTDAAAALAYYRKGLDAEQVLKFQYRSSLPHDQVSTLENLDKALAQAYMVGYNYCHNTPFQLDVQKYFGDQQHSGGQTAVDPNEKVRVGYFSPDFNKNAVGYFVKSLLASYSSDRFEVYCYYNNVQSDTFTEMFQQYPGVKWSNVAGAPDHAVYTLMKETHKLHILVDLICHGYDGRVSLMAMKPAPVVINYLGFPDSSRLPGVYTHRITDNIVDTPANTSHVTETLLMNPGCFVNWQLFDNVPEPEIRMRSAPHDKVYIGIFNRSAKQHCLVRDVWKSIVKKDKRFVLCVKMGHGETESNTVLTKLYQGVPKENLKLLPFTATLDDYFDQFNDIDLCVDTFPYSGTTTTCSSLYMGVPVVTLYNKSNPHVSNVTASILHNIGRNDLVTPNLQEYKELILNIGLETLKSKSTQSRHQLDSKQKLRQDFLQSMDPQTFMQHYEELLLRCVH